MTDLIIGLIPDYGLLLLFIVVTLACLAVPLPSSLLVLTSGAFAATGDLILWQVFAVSFAAFIIGDQIAYWIAAGAGPRLLGWLREKPRLVPVLQKSKAMLDTKGTMAVFLSHTIFSPTCPYVSYLCGAGGMRWSAFSLIAGVGAAIWVVAYVSLGYIFAAQLSQVATILSNFLGVVLAGCLVIGSIMWLRHNWLKHVQERNLA